MKIIVANPPNIEKLKQFFEVGDDAEAAFCYGEIIYNPRGTKLAQHQIFHEEIHFAQQTEVGGPEIWWDKYITDVDFRILQEVVAYGRQVWFIREEQGENRALAAARFYAACMAGPVYANMIDSSTAYKKIIEISELGYEPK